MQPNQAQESAIRHFKGPCMVLAGPGSGKTFTIARRICYLIEHYKVRPENILVITFTKAASYEMQNRFKTLMQGRSMPVTFGTFHGVYFGILKWAYRLSSENILTEAEKYQLLRQIISSPELGYELEISDEQEELQDLITEISNVKNRGVSVDRYESARHGAMFGTVYKAYEKQRKALRKIDFDDMLLLCYDLFRRREDVLAQWQKRFRYILIDEFQDVNQIQYEVVRMLAFPENNLFVVGDDDQSIYRFRGASPEIMLGFGKDYPEARTLLLGVNYRSSRNIVKGALKVIGHNRQRFGKKLSTENKKGSCIHVQEVKDSTEEGRYVIRAVKELKETGLDYHQIAVLYRTGNDARVLTELLMENQIPFQAKEQAQNIYEHFAVKKLLSYVRMAQGDRSRRVFLDVMNAPKRYISRESLQNQQVSFEDLRRFYMDKSWMLDRIDQFEWDIQMLTGQTPYASIQYIRRHIGYDDYLKEYAKSRKINEEELFSLLAEVEERAKEFPDVLLWFAYIEEYTKALTERKSRKAKEEEGICLTTMHGAKGLEFDTVFIIQSNEGVIPYKRAKLDAELEEERRMFYVAMTRAKRKLVISYVKNKNGKEAAPSRFVCELLDSRK
ncbi:MAG: ATP-dependent helicase [Dorea sp.]|jgi:DNA helicase-2/ATP-dependent DNA helicase PcrA|nr:ATP-dependent helicase [Dorea sp.]